MAGGKRDPPVQGKGDFPKILQRQASIERAGAQLRGRSGGTAGSRMAGRRKKSIPPHQHEAARI